VHRGQAPERRARSLPSTIRERGQKPTAPSRRINARISGLLAADRDVERKRIRSRRAGPRGRLELGGAVSWPPSLGRARARRGHRLRTHSLAGPLRRVPTSVFFAAPAGRSAAATRPCSPCTSTTACANARATTNARFCAERCAALGVEFRLRRIELARSVRGRRYEARARSAALTACWLRKRAPRVRRRS